MFQQSSLYFHSKQDAFLLYLAKKSRDQLFVKDDDRFAQLQPLFASLYRAFPGFARKPNGSLPYSPSLFKGAPLLRARLPGRLTR